MVCVLAAEFTILLHFKPVRIIFFVLHRVVVTLFAYCAGQGNFIANARFCHFGYTSAWSAVRSLHKKKTFFGQANEFYHKNELLSNQFLLFSQTAESVWNLVRFRYEAVMSICLFRSKGYEMMLLTI